MDILERLTQSREKKRRHEGFVEAVVKVLVGVPADERLDVLTDAIDCIAKLDGHEVVIEAKASVPEKAPAKPAAVAPQRPYVDVALDFIRAHPEGVRTRDVAKATGQDTSNVDGTLRTLLSKGLISRDKKRRLWFPAPSAPRPKTKSERVTIREIINKVFAAEGGGPLAANTIFKGAQKLKPEINRSSVDGEIMRMKSARLLNAVGRAPHGGSLYALSVINGGGHAAPSAN